jgi:IclR family acetate operon transcriptional repressor
VKQNLKTGNRTQRGELAQNDGSRTVIARAAQLLRTLEQAPNGLSIAQLTRASGLPRTTVQRLVVSLEAEQLVVHGEHRVQLGPALARMAAAASQDLCARVRPHLEALSRSTAETADLWVLRDHSVVLIDQVIPAQEVRIMVSLGSELPLHCTAPGKALLAEWDNTEIIAWAKRGLPAATSRSLVCPQALLTAIEGVRQTGIAIDDEEHGEDVCALACAITLDGRDRHAIALAAPARRFHQRRAVLEQALLACVAALSA